MRLAVGALLVLGLAGCSLVTDADLIEVPDENGRMLRIIQDREGKPRVVVPDEIRRGEPFEIEVLMYEGCRPHGEIHVTTRESSVEIRPYEHDPAFTCLSILISYVERIPLRFDRTGPATITVYGRELSTDRRVSIVRTVSVR